MTPLAFILVLEVPCLGAVFSLVIGVVAEKNATRPPGKGQEEEETQTEWHRFRPVHASLPWQTICGGFLIVFCRIPYLYQQSLQSPNRCHLGIYLLPHWWGVIDMSVATDLFAGLILSSAQSVLRKTLNAHQVKKSWVVLASRDKTTRQQRTRKTKLN